MAIKINKISEQGDVSSSPKEPTPKQPSKRRGTRVKGSKKQLDKLHSMESTLEKFHSQSDTDLLSAIQPTSENEAKGTHRLEDDQKEARLVLLHRMMIRKVPPAEIAKQLGVSVAMYYKLRDQLQTRMRLDVNKVDVPYLIGDSLAFYDEVRSMALTMSSSASIKSAQVKVSAMAIALRAEADKNDFLVKCGVYSAPVVEHIVRGMVSTGNYSIVDGESQRVTEAHEINTSLASHLKTMIARRLLNSGIVADNCKPDEQIAGG